MSAVSAVLTATFTFWQPNVTASQPNVAASVRQSLQFQWGEIKIYRFMGLNV